MSDGKIYRCSWYFCSLCLTIAFINFKRRGNTKTFDKPRTGDEHHTQDTTRERGASEVSNDDGFELYDEVAADEREAIVPPMELSTDVLAMLATFDVDPIRGVPLLILSVL